MTRSLPAAVAALSLGALAWIGVTPAQRANEGDYLSTALRKEVNAFKKALRASPTTTDNFDERTNTLWKGINAYSLTGGPVPVNATSTIGACELALTEWKRGGPAPSPNLLRSIALFGAEVTLKNLYHCLLEKNMDHQRLIINFLMI